MEWRKHRDLTHTPKKGEKYTQVKSMRGQKHTGHKNDKTRLERNMENTYMGHKSTGYESFMNNKESETAK